MGKLFKLDLNDQFGYKVQKQGKGYKVVVRQKSTERPLLLVDKPVKNRGGFLYFKVTPFNKAVIDQIVNRMEIGEIIDDVENEVRTETHSELAHHNQSTKGVETMAKQQKQTARLSKEQQTKLNNMVKYFQLLPEEMVKMIISVNWETIKLTGDEDAIGKYGREEGYNKYLDFVKLTKVGDDTGAITAINDAVKAGLNLGAILDDWDDKAALASVQQTQELLENAEPEVKESVNQVAKLLNGDKGFDVNELFSKIHNALKAKSIDMEEILKEDLPEAVSKITEIGGDIANKVMEKTKQVFEEKEVVTNVTKEETMSTQQPTPSTRQYEVDSLGLEIRNYSAEEVQHMLQHKTYPYIPHAFTSSELGWYMDYSEYLPKQEKRSYTYKEVLAMCQYDEQERFLQTPVKDGEYGEGPDNPIVGAMCFVAEHWKKIVGGGLIAGLGYGLYRSFVASDDTHEGIAEALGDVVNEVSQDVSNH